MDFHAIRKDLEKRGFIESTIKEIIWGVDSKIIAFDLAKAELRKSKELFFTGLLLFALGLIATIGTYEKAITQGGGIYIIAYGPVLGGGFMAYHSKKKMDEIKRKIHEDF